MDQRFRRLILLYALGIALHLLVWWFIASAVVSGIKAVSGHCGERYALEVVVGGDWFCPEED